MRLISIFFALIFTFSWGNAQSNYCVQIVSAKTEKGISNVQVSLSLNNNLIDLKVLNQHSQYCFTANFEGEYQIRITHPDFQEYTRSFRKRSEGEKDTVSYLLKLKPLRIQIQQEVVVKAPGVPDTVFGREQMHVQDFELLTEGEIAILTYDKNPRKGSVLRIVKDQKILLSIPIDGRASHLYKDYRGAIYVLGDRGIVSLQEKYGEYVFNDISQEYFEERVLSVSDSMKGQLMMTNFSEFYPSFEYYLFSFSDSAYRLLRVITDDIIMELYRAEYKYVSLRDKIWAKEKEKETGIDKEIWIGARDFTRSIYYNPLYAPLYVVNEKIYVFDHYSDYLYSHAPDGGLGSAIEINYHKNERESGWEGVIKNDDRTQVYTVYEKSGYSTLGVLDLENGSDPVRYKLFHRYVDKIVVSGKFVYYIYRPFESSQKRFLYRERLPEDFLGNQLDLE